MKVISDELLEVVSGAGSNGGNNGGGQGHSSNSSSSGGLMLSGTKTHVKQCFLPPMPLLMAADALSSPVLPG
ncbi:TPA: hypothetical protein ACHKV3_002516 [Escherichia coli]